MSLQISQTAGLVSVNTTSTAKSVDLPLASQRQGRVITIKDSFGFANTNPITVNATGGNTFEDGLTTFVINKSFGSATFAARGTVWVRISEVNQGFPSTIVGLGTSGYVSTSFFDTRLQSTLANSISTRFLSSGEINVGGAVFSSIHVNMQPGEAPLWDSNTFPIIGSNYPGDPLAVDINGSLRVLKNIYVGSTTTKITTAGILTSAISSSTIRLENVIIRDPFVTTDTVNLTGAYGALRITKGPTGTLADLRVSTMYGDRGSMSTLRLDNMVLVSSNQPNPSPYGALEVSSGFLYYYVDPGVNPITSNPNPKVYNQVITTSSLISTVSGLGVGGNFPQVSTSQLTTSSIVMRDPNGAFYGLNSLILDANFGSLNLRADQGGQVWFRTSNVTVSTVSLNDLQLGGSTNLYQSNGFLYFGATPITGGTPAVTQGELTSTIVGLGELQYISGPIVNVSSLTAADSLTTLSNLTAHKGTMSTLTFYNTAPRQDMGMYVTNDPYTMFISGSQLFYGPVSVFPSFLPTDRIHVVTDPDVTSTIRGLGTFGYLSSAVSLSNLVSTAFLNTSLVSTIQGLATFGYLSSGANLVSTSLLDSTLQSTVRGLATFGYLSSGANLVSTSLLDSTLQSTVRGLGTLGYVSSTALPSTIDGLSNVAVTQVIAGVGVTINPPSGKGAVTITLAGNQTNYVTNYNQQKGGKITVLSNAAFPAIIASTVITTVGNPVQITSVGDGENGSPGSWATVQLYRENTALGTILQLEGSAGSENSPFNLSFIDYQPAGTYTYYTKVNQIAGGNFTFSEQDGVLMYSLELAGAVPGYISTPSLTSSLQGIGSMGYLSSLINIVSTPYLASTLQSTTIGLQTLISSFVDPTELASTVVGLGTVSFVSTIGLNSTLASTINGLGTFGYLSSARTLVSTPLLESSLISTVRGLGTLGYISTVTATGDVTSTNLTSTTLGLGTLGYISSAQLISTVRGLGSAGYVSTLLNVVSTPFLDFTVTSTTFGLGTLGYISSAQLISTVRGLGSAGYVSTLLNLVSTPFYDSTMLSSMRGLATFGYLSSAANLVSTPFLASTLQSTTIGLQNFISSSYVDPTELTSTVIGLGTVSFVSSIGLNSNLVSTVNALGTIGYLSSGTNLVSTAVLDSTLRSTVRGLGSAGYLSSANNLVSTPFYDLTLLSSMRGLGTFGYLSSGTNLVSTAVLESTIQSTVRGLATFGYLSSATNLVSTPFYDSTMLSSMRGLATFGYLSSAANLVSTPFLASTLQSTTIGLQNFISSSYVDPIELTSTVIGLGTVSFVSSIGLNSNLVSTVNALGTIGYLSSGTNLVSTAVLDSTLRSTVGGLATFGYLSSGTNLVSTPLLESTLQSTVRGLGTFGYLSSAINLVSTPFYDSTMLSSIRGLGTFGYLSSGATLVSTALLDSTLRSTVAGLGAFGYLSTPSLVSTVSSFARTFTTMSASISSLTASSINATQGYVSSLTTDVLTIGTGTGWVNIGPIQATAISSIQENTGALYATTAFIGNTSTLNQIRFWGLFGNYNNTILAEVSTGTAVGAQEFLVFKGSSASDRIRFQTTGDIRFEPQVAAREFSTATALATPTMILQSNLVGINTATPVATLDVRGTAFATIASTQQLFVSDIVGYPNTLIRLGFLSSAANLVSTPFYDLTLLSSMRGLGTFGYLSSGTNLVSTSLLESTLQSTVRGLGTFGYLSSAATLVSTPFLASTLQSTTIGLQNFISTSYVDPVELASTVVGLGTASFVSSIGLNSNLVSTVNALGTIGYLSSGTNLVSTAVLDSTLRSTVGGLATFGYLSSANNLVSTFTLNSTLQSTVRGLATVGYLSSAANLVSTPFYDSTMLSSMRGLATFGYLSSATNLVSTPFYDSTMLSSMRGLATFGYLSSANNLVSTPFYDLTMLSSMRGLGTFGYLSSVSNIVSTPFLDTALTSSQRGLGTFGYISTISSLVSTTFFDARLQSTLTNSISTKAFSTGQANIGEGVFSTIHVNMLPGEAPLWDSNTFPIIGSNYPGDPLAVDINGSLRVIKNIYVGSTTTKITTGGIQTTAISSSTIRLENVVIRDPFVTTETVSLTGYYGALRVTKGTSGTLADLRVSTMYGDRASISTLKLDNIVGITSNEPNPKGYGALEVSSGFLYFYLEPGVNPITSNPLPKAYSQVITTSTLISTVGGLGVGGNFSQLSTSQLITSSIVMRDPNGAFYGLNSLILDANFGSLNLRADQGGQVWFRTSNVTASTVSLKDLQLGGSTDLYQSNGSLYFGATPITGGTPAVTQSELTSTIVGLGELQYLSGPIVNVSTLTVADSLYSLSNFFSHKTTLSTLTFYNTAPRQGGGMYVTNDPYTMYVSGSQLFYGPVSLFPSFLPTDRIHVVTDPDVTSTTRGLGTIGYISSVTSVSFSNLVSTPFLNTSLESTVSGLNRLYTSDYLAEGILSGNMTLNAGSNTVQFVDRFDPRSWYDAGTYQFKPNVGGYYSVTFSALVESNSSPYSIAILDTNGNEEAFANAAATNSTENYTFITNKVVYLNGSTDYLTFSVYNGDLSSKTLYQGTAQGSGTFFSAFLLLGGASVASAGGSGTGDVLSTQLISTTGGITSNTAVALASTVRGLGTIGYISTVTATGDVTSTNLTSTTLGLGTLEYISSLQLFSTVRGLGSAGYLSTVNLSNLVSTPFFDTALTSSQRGLGTFGYLSTLIDLVSTPYLASTLQSTTIGLQTLISSFVDPTELTSTVVGLGTVSFVSTIGFNSSLVSTVNGLGTFGYLSSYVSSFNFLSSGFFLTSSIVASVVSTNSLLANNLVARSTNISSMYVSNLTGIKGYISSFQVDEIQFGDGTGWADFGPLRATYISSLQENTGSLYATNVFVGNTSTLNQIRFWGLFGNYNNTILAEVSTGTAVGAQEFLVFKGSSASDRIRFQTTGDIRFEPQVAAREFSTATALATPTMILQSNLVGINTATPVATLDVRGTIFAPIISTQQFFYSSINGVPASETVSTGILNSTLQSTVRGLGTIGYISSVTAVNVNNLVSTPLLDSTLQSTVRGLGTFGYVSTLINLVSTPFYDTTMLSSMRGLGTFGYLSTATAAQGNFLIASTGQTTVSSLSIFDTTIPGIVNLYANNSYLYYGTEIIGGATTANPQFITF